MEDVFLLTVDQFADLLYLQETTHEGKPIDAIEINGSLLIVQTTRGLYGTELDLPAPAPKLMDEDRVVFKPVEVTRRVEYDYALVDRSRTNDDDVYNEYYGGN